MLTIGIDASRAARANRTGTETYALELLLAMVRWLEPGIQLRLYTPHPPQHSRWPDSPQVTTRVIPMPRLWTHIRLATELQHQPPDVLFVPAHVVPLYCPVPAVVTVHDVGYLHYPQAHHHRDRWYLDWTTRRHTRVAQQVIVDSEATRHDLIRFYNANPDHLSVVYLGRDESLSPITKVETITAVKQKYGLPTTGNYFLYLGTLHPRKNLVRLVEAFGMIANVNADNGEPLTLVIAGQKGWLYEQIFEMVQTLELSDRVVFAGYVAAADKPALLSGALAFVFPSLFEGFGLPVLEAMSCGTPVLTSNVSSLPEVAGNAALLVNPHDTAEIAAGLRCLATDVNLRHKLVKRGSEQVKSFSWNRAAGQVLEILKKAGR